ncbi:MAG: hypothetical protein K0V04_33890 [Deltaproteobacteria bacterium]|nr:hypothetical protein [Deltaproteobacteria bacterium]
MILAWALGLSSLPAMAAPLPHDAPLDDSHKATAQALFDEGMRLMEEGKVEEACRDFDESQHLDPAIGTRFNLADCYERLGRLASAWVHYVGVADAAQREGQFDRAAFARARADALEPLLSRLRLEVTAVDGLTVVRDGVRVGPAQWSKAVPVDPGRHVIEATAPGHEGWRGEVVADEQGQTVVVTIPPLRVEDVETTDPAASPPPVIAEPAPTVDRPPRRGQWIAGFSVGGAGLAVLAAGGGFGIAAIGKQDRARASCPAADACFPRGAELLTEARRSGTASTVLLAVGGALLATGIVLLATAPLAAKRRRARRRGAARWAGIAPQRGVRGW